MPVYFIRAGFDGPVKIGYTADVARRIVEIQVGLPQDARIIAEIDGDDRLERWLHRRFKALHIRGEWFTFDNAMLAIQSELEGVDWAALPAMERAPAEASRSFDLARAFAAYRTAKGLARRLNAPATTVHSWVQLGRCPAWRQEQINEALRQDGHV